MDIYEKIVRLLIASGNVSEEKVEQARKLAESLVWDGEVRPTKRALDVCPECFDTGYRRVSPTVLAKCSCKHGQRQ